MDLETLRAETGATDTSNFKNAVDADDFFAPIASNADRILQGDIVKGDDGVFFELYATGLRVLKILKQAF